MDLHELRLFLHLSGTLHFARSARDCHVSPSTLSRAVHRLEEECGQRLFDRDKRSVRLTRAGVRLQRFASETLTEWQRTADELGSQSTRLSGRIGIFATVTACQSFLPEILSRFRQSHPDIHIQLETGYAADALSMLEEEAIDVTVAALPTRVPRGLVARVLTHTPLIFVGPTRPCEVSRRTEASPVDWSALPLVLPAFGLARQAVDRWLRAIRITPAIYSEVTGNEAILSLVSTGCGVGVVPRLVMERSPLRVNVRPLITTPPLGEFGVGVCTRRKSLENPLIVAFWESVGQSPSEPGL